MGYWLLRRIVGLAVLLVAGSVLAVAFAEVIVNRLFQAMFGFFRQ